jgi:Transglycosylase associated protein.
MWILALIAGGFIVGGLARFALPGPDPMPWYATIALGVGGGLIGGIIFGLLVGHAIGFLGAFIGAVVLLALYRKYVQRRSVFRA